MADAQPPILLSVFGSTRSKMPYEKLHSAVKKRFPGHPTAISYTSRMVREIEIKKENAPGVPPLPSEALASFHEEGHDHAVVQSVHLVAGHEFYRMLDEVLDGPLRVSIGLPLLWSYEDYYKVAQGLMEEFSHHGERQAICFIGHGTDHAAWTAYPALEMVMRDLGFKNAFIGVIEGEPGIDYVTEKVRKSGYEKVLLVSLMLVCGVHVMEDILGNGSGSESWKERFDGLGIEAEVMTKGLLELDTIQEIFLGHIEDALDLIPIGKR